MESGSTSLCLNELPVEVLHCIFHHFDIPDILRIRKVSQYLNEISHSRGVWSNAYRNAEFVRPPGPFSLQSANDLEKALVRSFRVDQNLRHGGATQTEHRKTLKLKEICYRGRELSVRLVFERFLVIAFSEEVRCYDLDSNSDASIIWRSTDEALGSFHCIYAIDLEGHPFAYVVTMQMTGHLSIYSFNVGEQSQVTLDLLHHFERPVFMVDDVNLGPRVLIIRVRPRRSDPDFNLIAMDVRTRTQFAIPSFAHATRGITELAEQPDIESVVSPSGISTSTHLFLAWGFYTRAAGWSTFYQAYPLPPCHSDHCSSSPLTPLTPSHYGVSLGLSIREVFLLHDAIVDPTTQDVFIGIRVFLYGDGHTYSRLGVLRLSAAPTTRDHRLEIGTLTLQLFGSFGPVLLLIGLHPSFNGIGRAIYKPEPYFGDISVLEYNMRLLSDDDEHTAKVIEYPCILEYPPQGVALSDYDPYSGRLCLRFTMGENAVIEIVDLAV